MGRPSTKRRCPTCGQEGLKRNGTRNGKVRWRCTKCGATSSKTRPDITRDAAFDLFQAYLRGKNSQAVLDETASGRSLRRRLAWCWKVPVPRPLPTGEIYNQVFLDGKEVGYNWVLLAAVNQDGTVVAWQWTTSENATAYRALISAIPPPKVVTVDGAAGGLKAIRQVWGEETAIQRCLIHVHRNNRADLTRNPKTMAGKTLLGLSKALLEIGSQEEASNWEGLLQAFYNQYSTYLKERSYARDNPEEGRRRGSTWWYTHSRDRRVYFRLARLARQGVLFTYLNTDLAEGLHSTTNIIESLNSRIDELCFQHRGLSEPHLICAVNWLLHHHTETPIPAKEILKQWEQEGRPTARLIPTKTPRPTPSDGPKEYDTGLTAEEGLWTRKGWAGRWTP